MRIPAIVLLLSFSFIGIAQGSGVGDVRGNVNIESGTIPGLLAKALNQSPYGEQFRERTNPEDPFFVIYLGYQQLFDYDPTGVRKSDSGRYKMSTNGASIVNTVIKTMEHSEVDLITSFSQNTMLVSEKKFITQSDFPLNHIVTETAQTTLTLVEAMDLLAAKYHLHQESSDVFSAGPKEEIVSVPGNAKTVGELVEVMLRKTVTDVYRFSPEKNWIAQFKIAIVPGEEGASKGFRISPTVFR